MEKLKLLDLFSGIGGFTYAAERLVGGFKTVQFVEIDPFCQSVLRKHFSDVPIHDDIQTFKPLPNAADVVTGGFPCQDISYAGNNAGIKQGTRSGLFYELNRVIRKVRPRYVVLENVAALRKRGLDIVLGSLAQAGFNCEWACIPAAELGASHRRDRIWIVAYAQHPGLQRCGAECQLREGGKEVKAFWRSCHTLSNEWRKYLSKPTLCRRDDGFSHRVDRIKALGNAVVPQVAAVPLTRIIELHKLSNQN